MAHRYWAVQAPGTFEEFFTAEDAEDAEDAEERMGWGAMERVLSFGEKRRPLVSVCPVIHVRAGIFRGAMPLDSGFAASGWR